MFQPASGQYQTFPTICDIMFRIEIPPAATGLSVQTQVKATGFLKKPRRCHISGTGGQRFAVLNGVSATSRVGVTKGGRSHCVGDSEKL